jgi:hypothetical protein
VFGSRFETSLCACCLSYRRDCLLPSWKAPWHALELSASCQSQIALRNPETPNLPRIAVHDVPPPP